MRRRINKIRIPLEDLTEGEKKLIDKIGVRYLVIIDKEPCLTCVLPNTKILSLRTGYRRIEDVQKEGSAVSHSGHSTRIRRRIELYYSGKIAEITGVGMRPVSFTKDHEIWVTEKRRGKKIWKLAGDVTKENYLVVPKIVVKEKSHFLKVDSEIIGMFVADGFVDSLTNQCRSVVIRQNEKGVKDIVSVFSREGLVSHVYENSNSNLIEVHDIKLARWLRWNFYDSDGNKVLPSWFLRLPIEEVVKFVRGYLHDGYVSKRGVCGFGSKNEKLINQVGVLLLRLGVFPKVSYEEEEKEYKGYSWTSKMFKIRLSIKHSQMLAELLNVPYPKREMKLQRRKWQIVDTKRYFYVPIKEIKEAVYSGFVENIQTRSGTFTLPFVVHNCGHKKRVLHVEKSDGRRELIKECLFCITKVHTSANREGP